MTNQIQTQKTKVYDLHERTLKFSEDTVSFLKKVKCDTQ